MSITPEITSTLSSSFRFLISPSSCLLSLPLQSSVSSKPSYDLAAFRSDSIPLDSEEFCAKFLEEEKVMLSPGSYFDMDRYLRINVGGGADALSEGLDRLKRFMSRI